MHYKARAYFCGFTALLAGCADPFSQTRCDAALATLQLSAAPSIFVQLSGKVKRTGRVLDDKVHSDTYEYFVGTPPKENSYICVIQNLGGEDYLLFTDEYAPRHLAVKGIGKANGFAPPPS